MAERPLLSFVVGARPNFVKASPVIKAAVRSGAFRTTTIHTGQHYDEALSDLFFEDLDIPAADVLLQVGSGSHARQTAEVMVKIEPVLEDSPPDCLLVFGDVNSTVAAALTAAKLGIRVAHVESGLRSFDRSMPEEINRTLTDAISDLLFTTEESGRSNLLREGIAEERIHFVGNTMIDSLLEYLPRARELGAPLRQRLGVGGRDYAVLTLHRPSNVDDLGVLAGLLAVLVDIAAQLPILFPVHPRTRARIEESGGLLETLRSNPNLVLIDPLGYLDFIALLDGARLVLTDSGGIQEETTALGVPCLTLRENTERPVTVELGTNTLAGVDPRAIEEHARAELERSRDRASVPEVPRWDGNAAMRLLDVLHRVLIPGS